MSEKFFVSYSRQDEVEVTAFTRKLRSDGYKVWFDQDDILPGQDWRSEARKAIKDAPAVIICVSLSWVERRGFVHSELKFALEVAQEMPNGEVYIIPVKLDPAAKVPDILEKYSWVELASDDGYSKLRKALDRCLDGRPGEAPANTVQSASGFERFLEDMIEEGNVVHRDAWSEGTSEEQVKFKKMLKGRADRGFDLIEQQSWQELLELWRPLEDHAMFDVDYEEWGDKPFFRAEVQYGKCQTLLARIQLTSSDLEYLNDAISNLREVVKDRPYSMKGAASNRLRTTDARVANLTVKHTLEIALKWTEKFWGGAELIAMVSSFDESDIEAVIEKIPHRIQEIEYLLTLHPEPSD